MTLKLFTPNWPAPSNVRALQTTRVGGVSTAPYHALNLGSHVGDQISAVQQNRQLLRQHLPSEPLWLNQVHSNTVLLANDILNTPSADASISYERNQVCVVMTADCLPLLLCDQSGSCVAAIHAGWKGLASGIIENTIQTMNCAHDQLLCWLGPAIGPESFEVGSEVRDQFIQHQAEATTAFIPSKQDNKWLANLYLLARQRLLSCGVQAIYGGEHDTFQQTDQFFSYRREQTTGRMASLIWLA